MNTVSSSPDLASLARLADRANSAHKRVAEALADCLTHARHAGDLLIEAKAEVPHGQWEAWLSENFEGSARTARAYMQVADRWEVIEAHQAEIGRALPISQALKLVAKKPNFVFPKPTVTNVPSKPLKIVVDEQVSDALPTPQTYASGCAEARAAADRCIRIATGEKTLPKGRGERSAPVSEIADVIAYADSGVSAGEFAATLSASSEINAADVERLCAWLSDVAISLDRG